MPLNHPRPVLSSDQEPAAMESDVDPAVPEFKAEIEDRVKIAEVIEEAVVDTKDVGKRDLLKSISHFSTLAIIGYVLDAYGYHSLAEVCYFVCVLCVLAIAVLTVERFIPTNEPKPITEAGESDPLATNLMSEGTSVHTSSAFAEAEKLSKSRTKTGRRLRAGYAIARTLTVGVVAVYAITNGKWMLLAASGSVLAAYGVVAALVVLQARRTTVEPNAI